LSPLGAEGVGFEPTKRITPLTGFQDQRHRPLGDPSRTPVQFAMRPRTVGGQAGRRPTAKTDWPKGGRTTCSIALVVGSTTESYTFTIGPSLGVRRKTLVAM
jgi:hypothetical protein